MAEIGPNLRLVAFKRLQQQNPALQLREKFRSRQLQEAADISAYNHAFHPASPDKGAWKFKKRLLLSQNSLGKLSASGAPLAADQVPDLIQHRGVPGFSVDGVENHR